MFNKNSDSEDDGVISDDKQDIFGLAVGGTTLSNIQIFEIRMIAIGNQYPVAAVELYKHAVQLEENGDYPAALTSYNICLEDFQNKIGNICLEVALLLDRIGNIFILEDRFEEAFENYQKSLTIRRQLFGFSDNNTEVAKSFENMALVLEMQGRYEQAIKIYQDCIAIYRARNNIFNLNYARILEQIGKCLNHLNQVAQALPYFQEALVIRKPDIDGSYPAMQTLLLSGQSNSDIIGISHENRSALLDHDIGLENFQGSTDVRGTTLSGRGMLEKF